LQLRLEIEIILCFINGISTIGENITLNRCILSKFSRANKFSYSDYFSPEIFFNVHFKNPDEIKFSKIYCTFSNTQEWAQLSGFKSEQDIFKGKLTLTQELPPVKEFKIEDKVSMSIFLQVSNPVFSEEVFEDIKINQRIFFSFNFEEEYSYDVTEEFYIRHLQHFLSLATANPIYPLELMGKTTHNIVKEDNKEYSPLVKIFLHQEKEKRIRLTKDFNMLFLLKDINDSIENYIRNWFSNKELLQPTIGLFLGTLNNYNLFLENKFLNLAQSLESYHRRKINTKSTLLRRKKY
jgi:ApeA N-terminal domain 1